MEGYIGEIRLFAGNFAPMSWAYCNGASMSIAEYNALYAIIGVTYGGNGTTNFNLPDFRGRLAVGTGTNFPLGQASGSEEVTMTTSNMPMHSHAGGLSVRIPTYSDTGNSASPNNNVLASLPTLFSTEGPDSALAPITATPQLSVSGASQPFSIMQPYSALNYIICLEGIFPSRA